MPRVKGRLDPEAQHPLGAAGSQRVRIINAVTAGKGRQDQGQELVTDMRPTRRGAEVEVLVGELTEAEMGGQGRRQEEARIGHQPVIVEGHVEPVEAVR